MTKFIVVDALLSGMFMLASACNTNSLIEKSVGEETSPYLADSTVQIVAVDRVSVALPAGPYTQAWGLAATDKAWYALTATRTHWSIVDDVTIQLVDVSDSTYEVAQSFFVARGASIVRGKPGRGRSFLHVDPVATDSLEYVLASAPLRAMLLEYAQDATFIHSISLPDRTPITTE